MTARHTRERRAAQTELAREISSLQQIFDDLRPLAEEFVEAVSKPAHQEAVRDDLTVLRPRIYNLIAAHHGSIAGAGVITAPGLLADTPRWLEWWWTATSGTPEALRVNLDETTPDYFDYTRADWYSIPMRDLRPHAAGPYVDYFCTNEYTVTFALPARRGEPVGVAAADVLLTSLERRLVPILQRIDDSAVLTNASGRVIASASAMSAPGDLLDLRDGDNGSPIGPGATDPEACLYWRLVNRHSPAPRRPTQK